MVWIIGLVLAQSWIPQESGSTASLRGVSAVSANVVWASGTKGTYLRTVDGGMTWRAATVPGAADLDFRAIRAFDEKTAVVLSIGLGEKSRIYKGTNDQWRLVFTNPDPKGFFDALAFWDTTHGILLGDPVDGHFVVFTTGDAGETWKRQKTPAALANEGAFAASNTCLIVRGTREVWFGTGGARVFHSTDGGETWTVAKTPMRKDGSSAGIFSLAFSDARHGIAVGGDYNKPTELTGNIALTSDGGKTWSAPATGPGGYRSAVAYLPLLKAWIAVGTSGSDISVGDGKSWRQLDTGNYNALSIVNNNGWAVGPKGAIAHLLPWSRID
jgi:photosystem II stability/assembly factor-like uncharacterized protein